MLLRLPAATPMMIISIRIMAMPIALLNRNDFLLETTLLRMGWPALLYALLSIFIGCLLMIRCEDDY